MHSDDVQADLRSYYEEEARLRRREPLQGRRVELRNDFIVKLRHERCRSVLDFGAGPASDGRGFAAAGLWYVGIDLAHGNGNLAAANGSIVLQGSIASPPLADGSFDAGWSMSTLMHVPYDEVVNTLREMVRPLRSGAPLRIGLWGGDLGDISGKDTIAGQRRQFSLRPIESNARLLSTCGTIESQTLWDAGPDRWEYQVFDLRVH